MSPMFSHPNDTTSQGLNLFSTGGYDIYYFAQLLLSAATYDSDTM